MKKKSSLALFIWQLLEIPAVAQLDDPFQRFPLLLPQLGSEFSPDKRPTILDENALQWTMASSDYHLIDPDKLYEVFQAHPLEFEIQFQSDLERIRKMAQLHDYSMSEANYMLTLANILRPNMVTRLGTMLKYLNISIDEFNAYTEEKRKSEFCRYRVAIYRQNGIMYPKECWP